MSDLEIAYYLSFVNINGQLQHPKGWTLEEYKNNQKP